MSLSDFTTQELVEELRRRRDAAKNDLSIISSANLESVNSQAVFEQVLDAVATYYQIETLQILGPDRHTEIVRARRIAMYLCNKITGRGTSEIGRFFEKDHATVTVSINSIHDAMETDHVLTEELRELERSFGRKEKA